MSDIAHDFLSNRHNFAEEHKARGRKVLGYLCAYCPEEIVYAAGMVPVRVFGSPGPYPLAAAYHPDYYCAHARGCLNAGLSGEYGYLDGIVYPNACLHTQGAYDSWARRADEKYTWFIDMPSVVDMPEAMDFFVDELKAFRNSLENAFGVMVTEEDLEAGIKHCNEERALLRKIYNLKSESRPAVSGEEVFSLLMGNMTGANGKQTLEDFMADLESRARPSEDKARVMVLSTDLDDPGIFKAIESQGAVVVADNLCTGSRYIWHDVEPAGEPLEAIAKRYLLGVNCPLKHPLDRSLFLVEELLDKFNVEKAMFIWPQACDPMGWTVPFIKKMLGDRGIPSCWVTIRGGGEEDLSMVAKAAVELIGG